MYILYRYIKKMHKKRPWEYPRALLGAIKPDHAI
jgi:hypothetical protein